MARALGVQDSLREGTLFAAKEAYRTIRTNLMFSMAKTGCKTIVFTSSIQGEGKTTSAANVAFSMARGQQKVLLMDLDLRSPRVDRLVKKPTSPGLTNFLSGFSSLDEILHRNVFPNLDVICAGTATPNPAEMVASEGMAELIRKMQEFYDFIIIDTPPVRVVSDALPITRLADGVALVVRPKYTARKDVKETISQIELVGGKILGVIVNGVQEEKRRYGRYQHYGHYGETPAPSATIREAGIKEGRSQTQDTLATERKKPDFQLNDEEGV